MNSNKVLISRYINLINACKPDVKPLKDSNGSLKFPHILWMLEEMKGWDEDHDNFREWITWIQAALYNERLIIIRHEIDITKEIEKQK